MTNRTYPFPRGVTLVEGGANVAVYTENADSVEFCAFDAEGREHRTTLSERTGHTFHGFVPDVTVGTRYGLRVHGRWDIEAGLRFNADKLLLDPYATAIEGSYEWGQPLFGHDMNNPEQQDHSDSAAAMPRCVVTDPNSFDWGDDAPPRIPLAQTVIYETHVKGFTELKSEIEESLRGSYAGMAQPAAIDYLKNLGVTAVELLPCHQFVQDSHLLEKDLRNYWGYNSIGFLAPHNEYSSSGQGGQQVDEFKAMVKAMHAAGLEVIMDVVYNHTAEGNRMGPTLSLKGIDNPSYYRLVEDDENFYFDTTGTGNSLNVGHPAALTLIMDSLRYWVTEMHVDGFRFDLATTLTRQDGNADVHSAFLTLVAQDPVLAPIKMIAEPWDTAGYQVGGFPAEWSEWNGKFRDDVRDYWRGTDSVLGTVAQRVLGSPDVYEPTGRSPLCSVNFITAHDGFTLADLTAYDQKHNAANGEDNKDGESDNRSANNGAEGPTDNEGVCERRDRQRRNLLATLLLSAGVPMILGGDEMARTQQGNNNAYCQDSEISWYDWENADVALQEFTRILIGLRTSEPALHPTWYRRGMQDKEATDRIEILRSDAKGFEPGDWNNSNARTITFVFHHQAGDSFALLMNAAENGVEFAVPKAPGAEWRLEISSDDEQRVEGKVTTLIIRDISFTLLRSKVKPNIRHWARSRGFDVSDKGKVPRHVQQAFDEAHG